MAKTYQLAPLPSRPVQPKVVHFSFAAPGAASYSLGNLPHPHNSLPPQASLIPSASGPLYMLLPQLGTVFPSNLC